MLKKKKPKNNFNTKNYKNKLFKRNKYVYAIKKVRPDKIIMCGKYYIILFY